MSLSIIQPPPRHHCTHPITTGKEYLFISNVDNLGATVDLNLLYYLVDNDIEFCTGAVDITRADSDGGVMVNYKGASGAAAASWPLITHADAD